jgi:hypothetical protein
MRMLKLQLEESSLHRYREYLSAPAGLTEPFFGLTRRTELWISRQAFQPSNALIAGR